MTLTLLSLVLAGLFVMTGLAKLLLVPAMRKNADHLGFSFGQFRVLGVLEVLGAIGLALGRHQRLLAATATCGLIVMMVGAVVAHAKRADKPIRLAAPLILLGGLTACLLSLG